MKTPARCARFGLLLGLTAAGALFAADTKPAPGRITVIFSHPEKYADLRDGYSDIDNERGRERYLPFIREHLEQEAPRRLPAGQQLTVTFSEIDLAGDFEPWRGLHFDDIRVVKNIYVPRLTFSFKVTDAAGKVLSEGERKLVELGFQAGITTGFRDDPLRYEKGMLDDWLREEFRPRKG
jgi:hypothetical protein